MTTTRLSPRSFRRQDRRTGVGGGGDREGEEEKTFGKALSKGIWRMFLQRKHRAPVRLAPLPRLRLHVDAVPPFWSARRALGAEI